jgi:hypothetical protein
VHEWLQALCSENGKYASLVKFLEKEITSEGKGSFFFLEGCGGRRSQGPSVACGRGFKKEGICEDCVADDA